jgi:methionyl-tRNA formyltransferase
LISSLGDMGGQMLIDVLKQRIFVPPVEEAGWYGTSGGPVDHAGKITPEDRLVDFSSMTGQDILMRHRVLGNLWCRVKLPLGDRLILNEVGPLHITISEGDHGLLVLGDLGLCARSADGQLLQIKSCTVAGGKKGQGNAQVMRSIAAHGR